MAVDARSLRAGSAAPRAKTDSNAFVRKSSGLVKTGSPWRVFVMSFTVQGIGAFMATFYLFGVGAFPRTNLLLALTLCGVFLTAFNLAYSLLAAAYPRSGGEYVFLSRILHPVIGFVMNFGAYIAFCFFSATGAYLIFTLALAPALQTLGVLTDHPGLTDAGGWIGTNGHAWLLGSITIVLFAVMVCFGTQVYYRFQSVVWWVGSICFVLLLALLGLHSHQAFVDGFNSYVQSTGHGANGYQRLMDAAQQAGVPKGHSFSDTLGMAAVATSVTAAGAYMGGEVRTPLRTQLLGNAGGGVAFSLLVVLIGALIAKTVSLDFNQAAAYLNVQAPDSYGLDVAPTFLFYAFLTTTSPVLLVLMCLGIVLFTAILVPQQIMYPTRMLFAWSFDRLVPKQIADVEPRTGAPIKATVIVTLSCLGLLALYGGDVISYVNPILIIGFVWLAIAISAVLFPFMPRSRDAYRASGFDRKVLGVPMISVLGAFGVVFFCCSLIVAFTSDNLGANQTSNVLVAVVVFAAATAYYLGARVVRRRQGINLNAAFAELPPD